MDLRAFAMAVLATLAMRLFYVALNIRRLRRAIANHR